MYVLPSLFARFIIHKFSKISVLAILRGRQPHCATPVDITQDIVLVNYITVCSADQSQIQFAQSCHTTSTCDRNTK